MLLTASHPLRQILGEVWEPFKTAAGAVRGLETGESGVSVVGVPFFVDLPPFASARHVHVTINSDKGRRDHTSTSRVLLLSEPKYSTCTAFSLSIDGRDGRDGRA